MAQNTKQTIFAAATVIIHRMTWLLVLVVWCAASARGAIQPGFQMEHDPEIVVPARVRVFSAELKPLWLQALSRPEADLQRMAAEAIGRGHALGMAGMQESVPRLVEVLGSSSSHPAARLAAAQALVALDAKETAERMAASARKHGSELRQVVEPALAAWSYQLERAVWQARLTAAGVPYRDLVLAIRCLATAGEESSVADLVGIVRDRRRGPELRSEAALAAGVVVDHGLEPDARGLLGGEAPSLAERLCAVRLLGRHRGDEAQRLLTQLAVDAEPAVAVVALTRLFEIDPQLVLPLAERAMQNADAKVRQRGADAYVWLPDPQRVVVLAGLLDDPHPAVRGSVRDSLYELARRAELDGPIRRTATQMLGGQRWRGLEQAALLLGALDEKSVSGRLVELLEFDRPEVGVAAAWGLKNLAIPETLPAMFDKARRNTELRKRPAPPRGLDEQNAHLLEAFGRMKYVESEPLLVEHIPKGLVLGIQSRAAAIWSLGFLHAGVPDETLAQKLMERVKDNGGPGVPPELPGVRRMSAVSIARMKAVSQDLPLHEFYETWRTPDPLGMTVRWALIELTGEQIPEPAPPTFFTGNWFLVPAKD